MSTTAYTAIAANRRRSAGLIIVFFLVAGLIGWAIGYLLEGGTSGVALAMIFAVFMALIGYYQGDAVALQMAKAKGPMQKADNPYVWNLVENLGISIGLPMPRLFIIEDQSINAFATGRDPHHASLAITTGAITRLENEELEGVLAHELSHIQNYDIRFMTLVAILVGFLAIASDFAMRSMWFGGGRRRSSDSESNSGAGILALVGLVLIILAPIVAQLLKLALSRKREFLADASAALMTRYPAGLATALEKIAADQPLSHVSSATAHLYFSNPFGERGSLSKLFSTHPPIADRIAALRRMGA